MGGEGAMMAAIISLKNNCRRKKRTQFDKETLGGYGNGEKVDFDCPEVTTEVLKAIRTRLLKERKQMLRKRALLFMVITIALITLITI